MTHKINGLLILLTLVITAVKLQATSEDDAVDYRVIEKVIKECSTSKNQYSCIANKAATVVERAINWDVPVLDGINFVTNTDYVQNFTQRRAFKDGISRLTTAVYKFLDSHVLTMDLTENSNLEEARKKKGKKVKKIIPYLFMAMLGVLGISGPLALKTLALFAGKALIASKIALLIIGSVVLKKLFDHDHSHSKVKVLTHSEHDHHEDDYDRHIDAGAYKFLNTV